MSNSLSLYISRRHTGLAVLIALLITVAMTSAFIGTATAKIKVPISLSAQLINNPAEDGLAEIEVTARSMVAGDYTLKVNTNGILADDKMQDSSFTLKPGGLITLTYRFLLPHQGKHYKIWFTMRSASGNIAAKSLVNINAPTRSATSIKKHVIKDNGRGRGVRELGP